MCAEGEAFDLDGVNPWEHDWHDQRLTIQVAHPSYPAQRHSAYVVEIVAGDRRVRFAAGEMSAGAWAFYLPV